MTVAVVLLVVASMLSSGLELTGRGASKVPAAAMCALVAVNFVALPLFALGLMQLFHLSSPAQLALWLCVLSTGGSSSPALMGLARAKLASSGPLVLLLAGVGGVVSTAFATGSGIKTLVLLAAQFLPMALGAVISRRAPNLAARLRRPASATSLVLLLVVILGFGLEQGDAVRAQAPATLLASALLVSASLAGGWASLGPWPELKVPAAFASGIHNLSLALLLAPPEVPEVSAGILAYGLVMYVVSAGVAVAMRRRT